MPSESRMCLNCTVLCFFGKKTQKNLPSHYTKTAFQILCLMLEPPHAPAKRLGLSTPGWVWAHLAGLGHIWLGLSTPGWAWAHLAGLSGDGRWLPARLTWLPAALCSPCPRALLPDEEGTWLSSALEAGSAFPGGQLCSHSLGMESECCWRTWRDFCFGAMETDTHLPNILWKCLNTSNTLDHVCALLISELPILAVYFLAPGRLGVWCPSFQIHVWSMLSAQLASSSGFFSLTDLCTWMLFSR